MSINSQTHTTIYTNQPRESPFDQQLRQQLLKELKSFAKTGILFPTINIKLSPQDHYINQSNRPIRKIPISLSNRFQKLSKTQIHTILPHVHEPITIREVKCNGTPSWLCDTITVRKKYDHWYWKTRLSRTPFNHAVKQFYNPFMTKLHKRAHEFHLKATIQRNSHLEGPPKWLIIQSIEW